MGNTSTKLQPVVMQDLLQETAFTEKELNQWYRDFLRDFPSGELTIDQFKDVYIQHFPEGDAAKFAEHVFRSLDTDGDKTLDFREFITALSVTGRGGPNERLHWAFRVYDVNEDGEISKAECTSIIRALYRMLGPELSADSLEMSPEERTEQIYKLIDTDANGKITLEEFLSGANMDPVIVQMLNSKKF